jgi:hypothetical protein
LLRKKTNLNTTSDEDEDTKYVFTFSKPFSSRKIKLEKSSHPTTNNEEHWLRALADTGTNSSIVILEAYTSDPFIKTDDNNTTTWIKMGGKFTTTKSGICL